MRVMAEQPAPQLDSALLAAGGERLSPRMDKHPRRFPTWARALTVLGVVVLLCAAVLRAWSSSGLEGRLAKARGQLRDFQPYAALETLRQAAAKYPDSAEVEILLAAAYRRAGQLHEVDSHLVRASELGGDINQIDRQRYLTFFQAGDFRRSGTELLELLKVAASDDEAEEIYEAMARGYMSAMLLKQADFMLTGWLEWRPQSARAHLLQADVAALRGDLWDEIACYREAVRCDPKSVEARRRLARELVLNHQVDEAYDLYAACLRDQPTDPDVLLGLAECHKARGETDAAKKFANLVSAGRPNDRQRAAALVLLAQMAQDEKDYAEAARLLEEATKAHPSNIGAAYALSQVLLRAGRDEEAKTCFERWQRLKALDDKLNSLHSSVMTNPADPDLRTDIGEALLEQGATKQGVNWLVSVLFYVPEHPRANRLLAEHYERVGDAKLAARHRAVAEGKVNAMPGPSSPQPGPIGEPPAVEARP
jgi:tetratricopeptide (TPR) repeat protein